jgi:hypothetical protein
MRGFKTMVGFLITTVAQRTSAARLATADVPVETRTDFDVPPRRSQGAQKVNVGAV